MHPLRPSGDNFTDTSWRQNRVRTNPATRPLDGQQLVKDPRFTPHQSAARFSGFLLRFVLRLTRLLCSAQAKIQQAEQMHWSRRSAEAVVPGKIRPPPGYRETKAELPARPAPVEKTGAEMAADLEAEIKAESATFTGNRAAFIKKAEIEMERDRLWMEQMEEGSPATEPSPIDAGRSAGGLAFDAVVAEDQAYREQTEAARTAARQQHLEDYAWLYEHDEREKLRNDPLELERRWNEWRAFETELRRKNHADAEAGRDPTLMRAQSFTERQAADEARREEARFNAIAHFDDEELRAVTAELEKLKAEAKALGEGGYYSTQGLAGK